MFGCFKVCHISSLLTQRKTGLMNYTAAHHQGAFKKFWLHFWGTVMSSIFIYRQRIWLCLVFCLAIHWKAVKGGESQLWMSSVNQSRLPVKILFSPIIIIIIITLFFWHFFPHLHICIDNTLTIDDDNNNNNIIKMLKITLK